MKKLRKNSFLAEIMRTKSKIRVVQNSQKNFFSRTWIFFAIISINFEIFHLIMSESFIKFLLCRDRYRRSRSRDERRSRSRSRGGRRGRSRSGERRSVSPSRYRKQRHFGDRQVVKIVSFFYITKPFINIGKLFFIQEPNRSRCLGVFNLGRRTSEDEFRRIFERYGKIEVKAHNLKFWNVWWISNISFFFNFDLTLTRFFFWMRFCFLGSPTTKFHERYVNRRVLAPSLGKN